MGDQTTAFIIAVMLLTQVYISTAESCELCPPGTFMKQSCTDFSTVVCEQCPSGTFTDTPNNYERCVPHRQCEGSHKIIKSPGDAMHNLVCECQEGYHLEGVGCVRNPYCPPGEGVIPTGDGCEKCFNGTYSDKVSNIEPCIHWTNCSEYGEDVISDGTSERNTECTGDIGERGDSTTIPGAHKTTITELQGNKSNRETVMSVSVPTTLTVGIVVAAVSSILTLVVITTFVAVKCIKRKHQADRTQIPVHSNEEGFSDEDHTDGKNTEVHEAVECEEDSLPTHPKANEAFSPVDDCDDSQRLLHPSSQDDFVSSNDRPVSTDSVHTVTASNPIQDDEMLADEISHPLSSDAVDIPGVTPLNGESSPVASTIASSRETTASSLADREEGMNLVLGVYSDVVTNRVVDQLASELGDNWKDLAPHLDVKQYQVDHILNEHKGNIREQVFAMLRNWRQGKTGDATLSDLYEPLLECNRGEVFSRLQAANDPVV